MKRVAKDKYNQEIKNGDMNLEGIHLNMDELENKI